MFVPVVSRAGRSVAESAMAACMANETRKLLLLGTFLETGWDETYNFVPFVATGRYLYYDHNIGIVDALSTSGSLSVVVPRFKVGPGKRLEC